MSDSRTSQGPADAAGSGSGMEAVQARRDSAHRLNPSDSPCVAVCSTLYDEVCRGCGRTAMEVANWVFLDDEEKLRVWQRITEQGYPKRKG